MTTAIMVPGAGGAKKTEKRIVSVASAIPEPQPVFWIAFAGNASAKRSEGLRIVRYGCAATNFLVSVLSPEVDPERPWQQFLEASVAPRGPFTPQQVRAARLLWRTVRRVSKAGLPLPTIRESATGSLVMLWETQRALVESEVLGDGTFEWFSKDKQTGAFGGSDDERLRKAPRAFVERLESAYVR